MESRTLGLPYFATEERTQKEITWQRKEGLVGTSTLCVINAAEAPNAKVKS